MPSIYAVVATVALAAALTGLPGIDRSPDGGGTALALPGPRGATVLDVVAGPRYGTYGWPVRGPVLRGFDPPESTYGAGHRGIDIGAPLATPVVASESGVVAFAGAIGSGLFVSIDHPDGVRTTYSWLSAVEVERGDDVERGDRIGASGPGHAGGAEPHLHFGARVGGRYVDPMLLLERGSLVGLVHLAPLEQGTELE